MRERKITDEDWVSIQGGKPTVTKDGNLTIVTHNYPEGEDMIIKGHRSIEEMGTVKILVNDRPVEVPIALMRKLHGVPCEITVCEPAATVMIEKNRNKIS